MMESMLCYAAVYGIEALITWEYFHSVFEIKRKTWQWALALFGTYFVLFVISQAVAIFWINAICFITTNSLLIKLFFDANIKACFFHVILMTVIMNVTELLTLLVLGNVFEDFNAYQKKFGVLILLAVLSKLLYFILMQLCIRLFGKQKEKSNTPGKVVVLLCFVPFVSMVVTLTMIWIGMYTQLSRTAEALMVICSILLAITNIVTFIAYRYNQDLNQRYYDAQLELQKEEADAAYYKMLEEQYKNQRILIHDIRRHLQTIGDLAAERDITPITDYVSRLEKLPALQKRVRICGNPMLNLILSRYIEICRSQGVRLNIDVRDKTVDFINVSDMTALFGNLLQNAVEASANSEEAFIELLVTSNSGRSMTVVSVVNSCAKKPVRRKDGLFVTSKADKNLHGIGLKSIQQTAKKYGGNVKMYYNDEDNTFHSTVTLAQPHMTGK